MSDPVPSTADAELRAHVDRVLSSQYELDRELGRGGMGIVYKAKDRRLKRSVAIKILPPELAFRSEIRSRFLREAETAASLSHPNIVPIYTVDEREGLVYFVMELVEGENLAVKLHARGRLPADQVRRILHEVAEALAYAHERRVVHRDIKPDNILICEDDGRVKVTDFGIARAVSEGADARLTATGMAIGTPAYMSPEQSMGEREVDGRSDLYSLGIVGYQMLTGELPFNAPSTPAMLVKHISERPTPVEQKAPEVPSDLGRAVMMLIEKEPANRFPNAQSLVAALETGEVPHHPTFGESAATGRAVAAGSDHADYGRAATLGGPGGAYAMAGAYGMELAPTGADLARWSAPAVEKFRKSLAPFIAVGAFSIVLAIVGGPNFVGIIGFWGLFIAYKYARLWTDGYDWRDVFKQPQDRLFFDVVAEALDDVRALWDRKARERVRERGRLRGRRPSLFGGDRPPAIPLPTGSTPPVASLAGKHGDTVRRAAQQRDEVVRIVDALPKREREQIGDVLSTAVALYQRIEGLAFSLAELDRSVGGASAESVEQEISRLEAQANPLDRVASEERIRRLAYLKRQRRAIADADKRHAQLAQKLESCALALHNMQLDVLRLRTGGQSFQQITLVAERAMSLAREVDNAVYVADEMAKLRGGRESGIGRRR